MIKNHERILRPGGGGTHILLITSRMRIQMSHRGRWVNMVNYANTLQHFITLLQISKARIILAKQQCIQTKIIDYMAQVVQKCFFRHMQTAKAQIRLRICAV